MEPIAKLKQNMLFSNNLATIIDALKMIASFEFRKLSSRAPNENFVIEELSAALRMFSDESKNAISSRHNERLPKCVVMICSDAGFLGEVNSVVVAAGTEAGGADGVFVVLGDKGAKMLNDLNMKYTKFSGVENRVDYKAAVKLSDYLFGQFFKKKIGSVEIVFMKFISFIKHQVQSITFLPYDSSSRALDIPDKPGEGPKKKERSIIEPSKPAVLEYIIRLWLREQVYNIFWSAKLSEWSARVMHLEASSRGLEEQNKALKFRYFKTIHALNDKNIREVFAALKA